MENRFSYPGIAKIIALVALLLAVLALLGVAATTNLALWSLILIIVAVLVY